jgi:hypothetical protein
LQRYPTPVLRVLLLSRGGGEARLARVARVAGRDVAAVTPTMLMQRRSTMVGSCVVVQRRRCEEAGRSVILSSRERLFVEEEDADMVVRARASPPWFDPGRVQEDSCLSTL